MQSASCCVLLVEAVQVERDVLHVAWRGGASGEGRHPARCLEKRRRWRGPSCMLLGGAVRVERRPACCWVERCKRRGCHPACCLTEQCGWWGNVGNVEEAYAPNTRRFTPRARAQHAPLHAASMRRLPSFVRVASRRRCTPSARRFPPQVHAACAPLPAAGARRVRAVTDWKQSRSAAIFVLHLFYALKCTFPSKHSNKLKKKCAVGENPSTPSCKSALWYCPHRAWSEQPCNHGDVNGARHVFAPPVALKGCVTGALLRASCIIRRMAWLTLSFPSP